MAQILAARPYTEPTEDPNAIMAGLKDELKKRKAASGNKFEGEGKVVSYIGILGNRIRNVDLERFDHHEWSGLPMETYPKVIPSGVNVYVQHQGTLHQGVKGGFAFIDASARMWLVAFDYQKNKVYVEAGSSKPINWEDVRGKLDAAPSNIADHKDPIRGAWVSAMISDSSLLAFFLVDPSIGN
ncbi:uncharacterized protein LOC141639293 [Silene latifolia]|uniref:uncharacterized protein LOC141639293 n=1 Tax=Silene latifolia TaxID=37657 RepID=UPI003D7751C6